MEVFQKSVDTGVSIILNTGDVILLSPEDLDLADLTYYKTSKGYFNCRTPPYRSIRLHRLIAKRIGLNLSYLTDHKDNNKNNNTRSNLREATNGQNRANSKINTNNLSGHKGVHFKKGKWYAQINHKKNKIFLGYFDSAEKASKAYNDAADRLFGEFARHDNLEVK